jgi:hypothetical protein
MMLYLSKESPHFALHRRTLAGTLGIPEQGAIFQYGVWTVAGSTVLCRSAE